MLAENNRLRVRLLEPEDSAILAKWLSDPKVLEFYEGRDNPFDLEKVKQIFFNSNDTISRCLIEYNNIPIGYVQFYPVDDLDEYLNFDNIYGMDQFIGEPNYWNRGIGTLAVSTVVDYLVKHKQAEKVVMDPQVWNKRAIRCYEKCGFKTIKLLPKHELHEGEYRDCWLMEYSPAAL